MCGFLYHIRTLAESFLSVFDVLRLPKWIGSWVPDNRLSQQSAKRVRYVVV
jgi:hypothetical protein